MYESKLTFRRVSGLGWLSSRVVSVSNALVSDLIVVCCSETNTGGPDAPAVTAPPTPIETRAPTPTPTPIPEVTGDETLMVATTPAWRRPRVDSHDGENVALLSVVADARRVWIGGNDLGSAVRWLLRRNMWHFLFAVNAARQECFRKSRGAVCGEDVCYKNSLVLWKIDSCITRILARSGACTAC